MSDLRMTYRELKAALDGLSEQQLDQPAVWCGEERGGYLRYLWIEPEDLVGESGDHETWVPRSDVGTAVSAEDYAEAEVCVPAGYVSIMVDGTPPKPRFFHMQNFGVDYWFVARSEGHCRWILCERGVVIYDARRNEVQLERGKLEAFDEAKGAAGEDPCRWTELSVEQAALKFTLDGRDDRKPLSERELGAFFCSEY